MGKDGIDSLIEKDFDGEDINSDPGDVEDAALAAGPDKTMDEDSPDSGAEETPAEQASSETDNDNPDNAGQEAEAAATDSDDAGGDVDIQPADRESNYRALLREQGQTIRDINERNKLLEAKLQEAGILSDEDVENLNADTSVDTGRQDQLMDMLEMMRINPKFEDVDTVVSQQHHDDFVDALTRSVAEDKGISYSDAYAMTMEHIWGQRNPYKYLYENIKKHHPSYRKANAATPTGRKADGSDNNVAPSISNVGGGGGGKGGWTMSKIDAMDESQLASVPADVYDKYLAEELPK